MYKCFTGLERNRYLRKRTSYKEKRIKIEQNLYQDFLFHISTTSASKKLLFAMQEITRESSTCCKSILFFT